MKKLILLIFSLFVINSIKAQLFFTIDPDFFRIGSVYNLPFKNFCLYGKVWYGKIEIGEGYDYFYTQTIKMGMGVSIPVPENTSIYIGVNHSYFFNHIGDAAFINRVTKTAIDIGFSKKLNSKIAGMFIFDIINKEASIGFNFKILKK